MTEAPLKENAAILVVDDEESIRFTFQRFLANAGHRVQTARDFDEAAALLAATTFDIFFVDIVLGGKTGLDLLREIRQQQPASPVVIITGAPTLETAADALRAGAFDYIVKPVRKQPLLQTAARALQQKALADEKEQLRRNLEAIFRSVKDAIVTVDADRRVVALNDAATRLCGLKPEEAVGQILTDCAVTCGGKCFQAVEKTLASKTATEIAYLECHPVAGPLQVRSVSAAPLIDGNGDFKGGVIAIRDETRLTLLDRSLKERREMNNIIGTSEAVRRVKTLIRDLADLPTTILVTGESGTGKELVVEALHFSGERNDKPLVRVNCAAMADGLLESELFGHVRGAFTGAHRDRIGRFQQADGGTIFLDEIGDISPGMQLRLLRVIETLSFERVGESVPTRVDVRIVAATNRNLRQKVAAGTFREDLFYRLKVVEIELPPLRKRKEDILLLADYFLHRFNAKLGKQIKGLSSEAGRLLTLYPWPGNIRELENALEHACIRCHGSVIALEHLPADLKQAFGAGTGARAPREKEALMAALEKAGWNKSKAARLLGISRRTLYRRIDRLNLILPDRD